MLLLAGCEHLPVDHPEDGNRVEPKPTATESGIELSALDHPLDSDNNYTEESHEIDDDSEISSSQENKLDLTSRETLDSEIEKETLPDVVFLNHEMNARIERCAKLYLHRKKTDWEKGIRLGKHYIPMIRRKLQEQGLPQEIVWIPLIESCYDVRAMSCRGAGGMWQFMPVMARSFGLRVDTWIDERLDPVKSTDAALDALEYFYSKTGDWLLAFAAYNIGEGRVFQAMSDCRSRDFWVLTANKKLPSQTRFYVPAILALEQLSRTEFAENLPESFPWEECSVAIPHQTDIRLVAKCAGCPLSELLRINPGLKRGWTPPDYPDFHINIPKLYLGEFQKNFKSIPRTECVNWAEYQVLPGDTLWEIANTYQSSVRAIISSNNLKSSLIKVGWVLMIPTGLEIQ